MAHDEREWHMLRTGNDRCVRVRDQRPLALRGSITGKPEINGSTKRKQAITPTTFMRYLLVGSSVGHLCGKSACLCGILEVIFQNPAEPYDLFWTHQLLHTLEKVALLFADMCRESLRECQQSFHGQAACLGLRKIFAERHVLAGKFLDQRSQFVKFFGSREENKFFRGEMNSNFLLEMPGYFRLPQFQVGFDFGLRAVDSYA